MNNNIYKEYADLKNQILILELKHNELKNLIMDDMRTRDVSKVESEQGLFTVCTKKKWTYSRKLQKAEEDIKIAKLNEQESGKAIVDETEYLMFKPVNENS